jgi:hypothetical protein
MLCFTNCWVGKISAFRVSVAKTSLRVSIAKTSLRVDNASSSSFATYFATVFNATTTALLAFT